MTAWIAPDVSLPRGVRVLTTTRFGLGASSAPFDTFNMGLRSGDELACVEGNRAALTVALALPSSPAWLNQVHGVDVVRVASPVIGAQVEPVADASVTSECGVVLAVLTADCLPVALVAQDGMEVALAHAGWRGLVAGVLEKTVAAMRTSPSSVTAWLGPAAGPCIYEVGDEVRDAFLADDTAAAGAFRATRPGHWHVDLYRLARQRLARAGVTNVHGGDYCTISQPELFFSHRRDARTGRMATLAWIDA